MKKLFLLMLLLPVLSGCSFVTLERQIYPICMSIDLDEQGGYLVGVQAPSAAGGAAASYEILTASGDTFDEAVRALSAATPYPLNFSQIRMCLVSYDLAARTPLQPLFCTVLQFPTMRPTAYVSITLGSAAEVMQNQQPDFGMRLSTHLRLMLDKMQREHLLPPSTLASCVRDLSDGRSDLLIGVSAVNRRLLPEKKEAQKESAPAQGSGGETPAFALGEPWSDALLPPDVLAGLIPHTSENPVEYLGSAAISDGRAAGVLTADQTQLALRVLSEAMLKVARQENPVQLQIHLPPKSDLVQNADAIRDLMSILQALDCDALTFGRVCSMGFLTDEEWERFEFDGRYPHAEVLVVASDGSSQ